MLAHRQIVSHRNVVHLRMRGVGFCARCVTDSLTRAMARAMSALSWEWSPVYWRGRRGSSVCTRVFGLAVTHLVERLQQHLELGDTLHRLRVQVRSWW